LKFEKKIKDLYFGAFTIWPLMSLAKVNSYN